MESGESSGGGWNNVKVLSGNFPQVGIAPPSDPTALSFSRVQTASGSRDTDRSFANGAESTSCLNAQEQKIMKFKGWIYPEYKDKVPTVPPDSVISAVLTEDKCYLRKYVCTMYLTHLLLGIRNHSSLNQSQQEYSQPQASSGRWARLRQGEDVGESISTSAVKGIKEFQ
jgi:hypothetical protein